MRRQLSAQVWPGSRRRIEVRLAFCGFFLATLFDAGSAGAVRPFVTDDARIVNKGQLETESFTGMTFSKGGRPGYHLGALQGFSPTDWMEIIAGGAGLEYHESRLSVDDLVLQPKFLLHRSFGAIPSLSAAGGWLFPVSGNRQQWNSYAMAHASWFLFTPDESEDPYDNGLAIHVNLGVKSQYDAGQGRYSGKPYWAIGFEAITWTRELRVLGELFNGDPFVFEEKFPAFQTGLRWYKTPDLQFDLVWKAARDVSDEISAEAGTHARQWNHTIQIGVRFLLELFR